MSASVQVCVRGPSGVRRATTMGPASVGGDKVPCVVTPGDFASESDAQLGAQKLSRKL